MSEDIASNIEIFPIAVGAIISIIFVIICILGGGSIVSYLGLVLASAVAGFLCKNTTVYAIIYGALIGIITSLFIGLLYANFSIFILNIILGLFGAFIGKIIQSKVV